MYVFCVGQVFRLIMFGQSVFLVGHYCFGKGLCITVHTGRTLKSVMKHRGQSLSWSAFDCLLRQLGGCVPTTSRVEPTAGRVEPLMPTAWPEAACSRPVVQANPSIGTTESPTLVDNLLFLWVLKFIHQFCSAPGQGSLRVRGRASKGRARVRCLRC
jgi:hypothetical protein